MLTKNFTDRKSCPLCGSTVLEILLTQPYTDPALWNFISNKYGSTAIQSDWLETSFDIAHCTSCNFYFSKYTLTDEFYEKLTNFKIEANRGPEREMQMGVSHYSRFSFEAEKISVLRGGVPHSISVLEFGSGFGLWLLMAKAFTYKTTGIEIFTDRIAHSKKNGLEIYQSLGDVPDSGFDFIFSNQVFEHIADPLPILKILITKLKSGGIAQIGVPESGHIQKVINSYTGVPDKLIDPVGHINCFTNNALVTLVEKAGMKLLSPRKMRKKYLEALLRNKDLRYIREILLAGYKQKKSCTLYFEKL